METIKALRYRSNNTLAIELLFRRDPSLTIYSRAKPKTKTWK